VPKVELISYLFHYYYLALSLSRSGYLGHYITGPCATDDEAWIRRLGNTFERLWIERRLEGIPPHLVKRMWFPEIIQKGIKKCGGTGEQSDFVHNGLFARKAAWMMEECDVVHFINGVGLEAARKAKKNGTKIICDMRQEHPQFQEEILSEEARKLGIAITVPGSSYKHRVLEEIDLADHIFCPSSHAKRTFTEQGISKDKLVVCPYGVDTTTFVPRQNEKPSEKFTVLFLGSICMRKGVHYLLDAYKKAELKNARLVLVGPVDPAFRPILQKYDGLFEEVGQVPRSRLPLSYQRADVFVLPSLCDAYPIAVLEAMSTGLPIIISENTGTSEIIKNGREGFIVPIRDVQAIAEKLTFLFENKTRCVSMGIAAASTIKALNWDNYQEVCANFYKSILQ